MILLILLGITLLIAVGIFILFATDSYSSWGESLGVALVAIFFGAMVSLMAALILSLIFPVNMNSHVDRYQLANINDGQSINGHFYLGSGYINQEQVFSYYSIQSDKSLRLEKASASESSVLEDGGSSVDETILTCPPEHTLMLCMGTTGISHYTFHVPHGSITNSFVLDAK